MEVPLALLEAVGEQSKEGLRLGLAHLQAAEFLYEARLFPEVVYTFKHALTQEVAYSGVLHEWRRELHRRIVEALEALAGDRMAELVDRLAYHALRGQVWAKAVVYCRQAGEKAMAQSAHREAIEYFEQALRALPQLPETRDTREQAVDLRLALVWTPTPSGDASGSLAYLREAETLAEALDDPYRLGQVALFLAFDYRREGAHDQAIAAAQRALALATAAGEDVLGALANHYLGVAYWAKGAYPQAIASFGQVVASLDGARRYERFGQWMLPAAQSRNFLAVIHAEHGRFAQGFVLGEEGLRIAEAMTHPWSLMFTYWGMGLLCLHQGKVCQALAWLERAMRMCQEAELLRWFPRMAAALGEAYILAGRVTDAVPLLTQALEQGMAAGNAQFEMICTLALGEAQAYSGHLDAAHACAVRVLALAHTHQERSIQACALRLLGEIAARREPPEMAQATTHYHQALALAEALGRRPLQAHCHRGLGTLYATIGREDQAHAELSTAIHLYRAMEMTFWLPETEAALAQVEGR
jgi:tetratricopeptide (TPR) repeat protein